MSYPYMFAIGTSVAGLAVLPRWGLGWPDQWTYRPWSRIETRGNGSHAGFGYPTATWSWDNMGQAMLHRLLNRFDADDDASVEVYIRTYKDTGVIAATGDFLCWLHRPVDGQGKTLHARVRADVIAFSGVTVEFSDLVEQ